MKLIDTPIKGLRILEPVVLNDNRGSFTKIFNMDFFRDNLIDFEIKESFFNVSNKDVIRGMHFQLPPFEHDKVVYVPKGKVLDVVLDLRKGSSTYGKYYSMELSSLNSKVLIIPKGLAHGFKSLEDNTCVVYLQSSCYNISCDKAIKYDSFGFDWNCLNPILSQRDLISDNFDDFDSPFLYKEI